MSNGNSMKEPDRRQDAVHRRSAVYNLFILALIVFSWTTMAGVILGPGTS
jgi:hypothetical protein